MICYIKVEFFFWQSTIQYLTSTIRYSTPNIRYPIRLSILASMSKLNTIIKSVNTAIKRYANKPFGIRFVSSSNREIKRIRDHITKTTGNSIAYSSITCDDTHFLARSYVGDAPYPIAVTGAYELPTGYTIITKDANVYPGQDQSDVKASAILEINTPVSYGSTAISKLVHVPCDDDMYLDLVQIVGTYIHVNYITGRSIESLARELNDRNKDHLLSDNEDSLYYAVPVSDLELDKKNFDAKHKTGSSASIDDYFANELINIRKVSIFDAANLFRKGFASKRRS
jgi:hypothetical protein